MNLVITAYTIKVVGMRNYLASEASWILKRRPIFKSLVFNIEDETIFCEYVNRHWFLLILVLSTKDKNLSFSDLVRKTHVKWIPSLLNWNLFPEILFKRVNFDFLNTKTWVLIRNSTISSSKNIDKFVIERSCGGSWSSNN